ncbi:hypothetical protein L208DRAFT_1404344 [Tricholoma matsutake]|nr:hypothetical protein L208DRAFT_1404344 [Tricholoma matsutake 945]
MASAKSFTVYITQPLPRDSEASLLKELNQPDSQPTSPADKLTLSIEHAFGMSIKEIVNKHRTSDVANQIDKSMFVVADEGLSPSSYPHTVLIVNPLDMEEVQRSTVLYQAFRVLASTAAIVLTSIANGKHGWEDFWQIAQANGGHFPGQ